MATGHFVIILDRSRPGYSVMRQVRARFECPENVVSKEGRFIYPSEAEARANELNDAAGISTRAKVYE